MSSLPYDHLERIQRTYLSLDGLSIGDAFGQTFFYTSETIASRIENREIAPPPWFYTDDTEMAISIVEILNQYGTIEKDALAAAFATRYQKDWHRGYGGTAHEILREIGEGKPWKEVSEAAFSGMGSMGNGAAMRVAPLGAYFADDIKRIQKEAIESARPTHAHKDAQAGAVAIAVATAMAWQFSQFGQKPTDGGKILETVIKYTPSGETYQGIKTAINLYEKEFSVQSAAEILGSGYRILSSDTVPFALFCAARHIDHFEEALWTTVSGLGDRDTTCAMVGGIVCMTGSIIPSSWRSAREPLVFSI